MGGFVIPKREIATMETDDAEEKTTIQTTQLNGEEDQGKQEEEDKGNAKMSSSPSSSPSSLKKRKKDITKKNISLSVCRYVRERNTSSSVRER